MKTPIKAEFGMRLRDREVMVTATIEKWEASGVQATVQIKDQAGKILDWQPDRKELAQIFREASKVKRSD
jgi:hypothetical protein